MCSAKTDPLPFIPFSHLLPTAPPLVRDRAPGGMFRRGIRGDTEIATFLTGAQSSTLHYAPRDGWPLRFPWAVGGHSAVAFLRRCIFFLASAQWDPAFHRRFPNAAPLSHPDAPLSLNAGDRFVFVHPSWVTEVMGHNRHRINAKVTILVLHML